MTPNKLGFVCFASVAILAIFIVPANGIKCYQCISTNNSHPFQCNEYLTSDIDMEPTSCDHIDEAQYCVKHVGRFEVLGLKCYQCTSADEWKCMDGALAVESLQPESCDHIFEAQYCVKSIGRNGGGVGTKRFCSAKHLGNFCDYVKQPGDSMEYRTCLYTCTGDGCNPATALKANLYIVFILYVCQKYVFTPR